MKTYCFLYVLFLATGAIVLDVDKKLLTIILASGVATLFRLMYEFNHNRKNLKTSKVLMIVIVSFFLPYSLNQLINTVDFLKNIKLLTLFISGVLAIDIAKIIIEKVPNKLTEILDMIPDLIKGKLNVKKENDDAV